MTSSGSLDQIQPERDRGRDVSEPRLVCLAEPGYSWTLGSSSIPGQVKTANRHT